MGYSLRVHKASRDILGADSESLGPIFRSFVDEHKETLQSGTGSILKDSPESSITLVEPPGLPCVCVKEFRWRGILYGLKNLLRTTKGERSFANGWKLHGRGLGVPRPLALLRYSFFNLVITEWLFMEVIPEAMELDRYLVKRIQEGWTHEEKRAFVKLFAQLVGSMHGQGIFHSDLKTCNLLVSRGTSPQFYLLDYDDVTFSDSVSLQNRAKNLTQIFLSTPRAINAVDRVRFLREYAECSGLSQHARREIARRVLRACEGRGILYVGFDGDIVEQWQ